ncbi:beta-defensin 119 isoform X1 [Canis lupus baileyi]|uniref:Beta-defensin n=2 Tax=Canis lupus TaxID=9612 RepID=Q30KT4_CANLF|nr:beta-defensin 119 precursor [Canis lupus familiaris]XP_025325409.1 beta-defensin 119 isoform X1 [Canis lupus dingo]AAY59726.1 beta-defensin 120 [Canis lupus familiaris]|eukprot:NP_001271373.1 beta-defensin 119 precursor [Canis lupus familiaris]
MKFFLFFVILLAMEPVISEECWMNGKCRLVCKSDEDSVVRCENRKRCCVPSRYLTVQPMTVERIEPETVPHTPKPVKHKHRPDSKQNRNVHGR